MFKLFSTLTPNYHPSFPFPSLHRLLEVFLQFISYSTTSGSLLAGGKGRMGLMKFGRKEEKGRVEDFIHEAWLQGESSI